MGCGASNTLETSSFRKAEEDKKTKYLKLVENIKELEKVSENNFEKNIDGIDTNDLDNEIKAFKDNFKTCTFTVDEIKQCVFLALGRSSLSKYATDYKIEKDLVTDGIREGDKKKTEAAAALFVANCGTSAKGLFIDLMEKKNTLSAAHLCLSLKHDTKYAGIDGISVVMYADMLNDMEFVSNLASAVKSLPALKNLAILFDSKDNDGKKVAVKADNVVKLFEGMSLSKAVNFTFFALSDKDDYLDLSGLTPEEAGRLTKSLSKGGLKSVLVGGLKFSDENKKKVLEAIAANKTVSLIGYKCPDCKKPDDLLKVLPIFKTSKATMLVLHSDYDDSYTEFETKNAKELTANPTLTVLPCYSRFK